MSAADAAAPPGPRRRRRIAFVVLGLGALLLALGGGVLLRVAGPPEAPRPIADVSSERLLSLGPVVGFASGFETHAWVGLPYALPPTGALRWRAPRPAAAWAATRDALEFGRPCVQPGSPVAGVPAETEDGLAGDEDCLTLNVWAPRFEPDDVPTGDARLPVMVWIHGGGNTRGWPGAAMYDGARLSGSENVVVVSIAYRLGAFGWFSHPALRAEADDALEASGNFGTLDQIAALRWVQTNIEEFGGDPGNVTIFGESAGGTNVYALLLAEAAEGLFHRALPQSGSTRSYSVAEAEHPRDDPEPGHPYSSAHVVAQLFVDAGAVPDAAAARDYADGLPPGDLLAFLRARDAREVMLAYRDEEGGLRLQMPKPIRDGALLPKEDWLEALMAGRFHDVPVLAGATRDEWKLFLALDPDHVHRRLGILFRIRDREDYERRARLLSDRRIVQGVNEPLGAMRRAGHESLFAYRFDYDALPNILGQDLSVLLGAGHGLELPLLFGTYDVGSPVMSRALYREEARAAQDAFGDRLRAYWAAFARDGRPGRGTRGDLPEWQPWSAGRGEDGGRWLLLDDEASGGPRMAATRLDREGIASRLARDPLIALDERCKLYADVFDESTGWRRTGAAARLEPVGCSALVGRP